MPYYIYIISNKKRTTFYIGITNNLRRRMDEHKKEIVKGFSKKYKLKDLYILKNIKILMRQLEEKKQLKNWHRDWKINLIKEKNYKMEDLTKKWF